MSVFLFFFFHFVFVFFFFKQKTAYEIYQCDWSSDVCSSDLTEKWTILSPLPAPASAGSCIVWDGEIIIAVRGEGSKEVYQYTPGTDTWAPFIKNLTAGVKFGASICHTGGTLSSGTGRIWLMLGGNTTSFVYFDPTKSGGVGAWISRASLPASVEQGGQIAYPGSGDYIYASRGQSTPTFWRYSITDNSWVADVPPVPDVDTHTGTSGGEMWRGSRLCYPGTGNYLYIAMCYDVFWLDDVRDYQTFWRLGPISDTSPGTWERLADCPDYTDELGFIMYDPDGLGEKIDLLSGKNYSKPWDYDIATDKWREITQPPEQPRCNNHFMWWIKNTPGYEDYIYWLCHTRFWRYQISTNKWERLASTDWRVCRGGLRMTDVGGYLYILRGESTLNWARYDLSQTPGSDSWELLPDFPEHPEQSDTVDRRMRNGSGIVGVVSSGLETRTQDIVVGTDGNDYRCIKSHWADIAYNKPTTGTNYTTYWEATGGSGSGAVWIDGDSYSDYTGTLGHDKFIYAWRGQIGRAHV